MEKKPIQYFTDEYLEHCRGMKPAQIARFLDDFRLAHAARPKLAKSKLISLKVPEPLLNKFRQKAEAAGVPYQTQIKRLMQAWLQ